VQAPPTTAATTKMPRQIALLSPVSCAAIDISPGIRNDW
jgi:hypothetical protein